MMIFILAWKTALLPRLIIDGKVQQTILVLSDEYSLVLGGHFSRVLAMLSLNILTWVSVLNEISYRPSGVLNQNAWIQYLCVLNPQLGWVVYWILRVGLGHELMRLWQFRPSVLNELLDITKLYTVLGIRICVCFWQGVHLVIFALFCLCILFLLYSVLGIRICVCFWQVVHLAIFAEPPNSGRKCIS